MTTPYPFVAGSVLTAQQLNDIQNLPISDKTTSYTLVVADAYKRTMMNSASATTITVNNSIFTVGDVIQVANKGAGTCTITAGAGVTINTSGSLALAQYGGGYLLCLSASTFTFFSLGGIGYGAATGGIGSPTSVTIGGVNYQYLQFNATGTLTITRSGLFDVLIFAGGAGSAAFTGGNGGGAGGGGFSQQTIYLTANATITIGAGGAGFTQGTDAGNGYGGITSIGSQPVNISVNSGTGEWRSSSGAGLLTSGSGSGSVAGATNVGVNTLQGNRGGNSTASTNGGGGGGAGAVGGNGATTTGGAGGAGYDVSAFIGGSALGKAAGGGGGGSVTGGAAGLGGVAGTTGAANAAAANSGGGAGGGGANQSANGGSGVAYIRWRV